MMRYSSMKELRNLCLSLVGILALGVSGSTGRLVAGNWEGRVTMNLAQMNKKSLTNEGYRGSLSH